VDIFLGYLSGFGFVVEWCVAGGFWWWVDGEKCGKRGKWDACFARIASLPSLIQGFFAFGSE